MQDNFFLTHDALCRQMQTTKLIQFHLFRRQAFVKIYEQRMLARSEIDERIFLKPILPDNISTVFDDTIKGDDKYYFFII